MSLLNWAYCLSIYPDIAETEFLRLKISYHSVLFVVINS
jgi:hypothetical protein